MSGEVQDWSKGPALPRPLEESPAPGSGDLGGQEAVFRAERLGGRWAHRSPYALALKERLQGPVVEPQGH